MQLRVGKGCSGDHQPLGESIDSGDCESHRDLSPHIHGVGGYGRGAAKSLLGKPLSPLAPTSSEGKNRAKGISQNDL